MLKQLNFIKIACLTLIVVSMLTSCWGYKYEPARDTVAIFGDGRYQICKHPDSNWETHYSLLDESVTNGGYGGDVQSYYDDGKAFAYIVCNNEYIVIDYKLNKVTEVKSLSELSETQQEIFNDTDKFTALVQSSPSPTPTTLATPSSN